MRFKDMEFDWDDGNSSKIRLRFSLEEVEQFFSQDLIELPDKHHSFMEERIIAVGKGQTGRPMYVCFTLREGKIRVISARFMGLKEAQKYETFKKIKEE